MCVNSRVFSTRSCCTERNQRVIDTVAIQFTISPGVVQFWCNSLHSHLANSATQNFLGGTSMATIVRRPGKDGQLSYRAQVRRKGASSLSATFTKLSDAKKWIQITEAAILEGRHFKTAEAKRHTLAEMVDRYICSVLPRKRPNTIYMQTLQ